jgi:hypothetical protein
VHEIPLAQIFALNACHAWGEGLSPAGATYEDQDLHEALDRIMTEKSHTQAP